MLSGAKYPEMGMLDHRRHLWSVLAFWAERRMCSFRITDLDVEGADRAEAGCAPKR